MIDLSKETLKLNYPCKWEYKIVVLEKINVKNILKEILGDREHKISKSKVSKKGKFISYSLKLIVFNEDDRKELYKIMLDHEHIKMIV